MSRRTLEDASGEGIEDSGGRTPEDQEHHSHPPGVGGRKLMEDQAKLGDMT